MENCNKRYNIYSNYYVGDPEIDTSKVDNKKPLEDFDPET